MAKRKPAPVNLATLPLENAMSIARAGGANFLAEPDVVAEIRNDISTAWLSKHMPWACPGMSDEEFDARMAALHSAFHDGLDHSVVAAANATVSARASSYQSGVKAALTLLSKWKQLGESGITPAQLTAELTEQGSKRAGRAREGLTDTIAAFIILTLDGNVPIPKDWDAHCDLAAWRVSYD